MSNTNRSLETRINFNKFMNYCLTLHHLWKIIWFHVRAISFFHAADTQGREGHWKARGKVRRDVKWV